MERLSYASLKKSGYEGYLLENAPERVLQFGEGNFLRAFVDYFFDVANEKGDFNGKVVLVQPIAQGLAQLINEQQGLYTLYLRGAERGKEVCRKRVVSAVSRCIDPYADFAALLACAKNPELRYIVSNTTEAGITYDPACRFDDAPASSFPGKLTRFLYERYKAFGGDAAKGVVILSCELIDDNGRVLKSCVDSYCRQWGLEDGFVDWLSQSCVFCSTLVDRIVTGYPRAEADKLNEENGYEDKLLDTGEVFGFWVIEGPQTLESELPFKKAGLPVIVVPDSSPYKKRKVRILNGAHTSMVLAAYLCGKNIVRECMHDPDIRAYLDRAMQREIIPTLTLPKPELEEFADAVIDRFNNPFIDHALLSISLNSTSKWRARVLPSLKEYVEKFGSVPPCLAFSFAAYIAFYRCAEYKNGEMTGRRGDEPYAIKDDAWVLDFYAAHSADDAGALVREVMKNEKMWGEDLTRIPGFEAAAAGYLREIRAKGMSAAMKAAASC
ncbi:MAG: tagaturonate reductase [Oscillospiraceae bacterium]|nr:tagaturonate reductase [Oscillospiraceae bacterium]